MNKLTKCVLYFYKIICDITYSENTKFGIAGYGWSIGNNELLRSDNRQ